MSNVENSTACRALTSTVIKPQLSKILFCLSRIFSTSQQLVLLLVIGLYQLHIYDIVSLIDGINKKSTIVV